MSISWDSYFMSIAVLSSKRSKDPNTKVGAVIIDSNNRVISVGYNGFPNVISELDNDKEYSWDKTQKHLYVVHAEENCILNGNGKSYEDCTMYCTLFPCNKCAQSIVQTGIKKVIYLNKKEDSEIFIASRRIMNNAHISYQQYKRNNENITICL